MRAKKPRLIRVLIITGVIALLILLAIGADQGIIDIDFWPDELELAD